MRHAIIGRWACSSVAGCLGRIEEVSTVSAYNPELVYTGVGVDGADWESHHVTLLSIEHSEIMDRYFILKDRS